MTYYIDPIWFYLMNTLSGIKLFLSVLSILSLISFAIISIIYFLDVLGGITDLDNDEKKIIKLFMKIIIASIISLFISILIPSKETCIEMMIASQVTHENVIATKEEIYEIVDYITDKVKGE